MIAVVDAAGSVSAAPACVVTFQIQGLHWQCDLTPAGLCYTKNILLWGWEILIGVKQSWVQHHRISHLCEKAIRSPEEDVIIFVRSKEKVVIHCKAMVTALLQSGKSKLPLLPFWHTVGHMKHSLA